MIDYLKIAQEYHGGTDVPRPIQLSEDDYIKCRYDAQTMQWIFSRPSRIRYQTAKQLIKQYRKEYVERLG